MQKYGPQAAFIVGGWLSSSYWAKHLGEPWRATAAAWQHWAISLRHFVAQPQGVGATFKRLIDHHWQIDGAADHGVSEAIYFH